MARPKRNADCHPDRPHHAKGLCHPCYNASDDYKKRNRQRARKWQMDNRERYRGRIRDWRIRRDYGISAEEYDKLLSVADSCSVCGRPFGPASPARLDHNHDTGKRRDFLCQQCNTLIGMAFESPEILRSAILYLEKWNAGNV